MQTKGNFSTDLEKDCHSPAPTSTTTQLKVGWDTGFPDILQLGQNTTQEKRQNTKRQNAKVTKYKKTEYK